jgi:hypothetical protein
MRMPRRIHVNRRAVDEEGAGGSLGHDVFPDLEHVLAGGQHGDHRFRTADGSSRIAHDLDAIAARNIEVRRHEVEAEHAMARLDQVGGHRVAHITEADEGDGGHVEAPF